MLKFGSLMFLRFTRIQVIYLTFYNMNDNPKNNILISEDITQKRLTILEYLDAYSEPSL